MKIICFLAVFACISLCLSGQSRDTKEEARRYFASGAYSKALPLFRNLLAKYPGEPEYKYCAGVCMVKLNTDPEEAINLLRPAPVSAYSPLALYYLGRACHLNYSFDEAIRAYSKFMMKAGKAETKKYDIERLIEMARNGLEFTRTMQSIQVQDKRKVQPDQLQVITGINGSGKVIRKPVEFSTKTDMRNGYRPWMFLPSYTEVNDYIYVSGFERGKINKKQIFRLRNMNHETWGFPEVLSDMVNTPYDEEFPYFDTKTSTLYFSSTGHSSMGGYDIFKSVYDWNTKTWSKPENMGFPINSPYDDYAFITDELTHTVSFVTNRNCVPDQAELFRVKAASERVELSNIDDIRKASALPLVVQEKSVKNDTVVAVPPPGLQAREKSDYNRVLAEALQLQIKADSFARVTRDLRIMAKEAPDDSVKKHLVTGVIRNDKMAKSLQREADAKFTAARKLKEDMPAAVPVKAPVVEKTDTLPDQPQAEAVAKKDEFALLDKSPYTDLKPIPVGLSTETGLIYRIQLGAFSKSKPNNAFGGISPLWVEQVPGTSILKYYAGKFYSHNAVTKALETVRSQGFPDAFIVAFYEGKPITTEKAKEIEFSGFRL